MSNEKSRGWASGDRRPDRKIHQCPMPYALCPMPYALCPMPYALCPMPYALCPMPYARSPRIA
jgi:hypothetical protein